MADFPFFKMAAVHHLGFLKVGNFNFRSSSEAHSVSLFPISRRSVEPFRKYGRFSIFKMTAVRYLGLLKVMNYNFRSDSEIIFVNLPNFAKIGQTVPELWPIINFQDGGRPPS